MTGLGNLFSREATPWRAAPPGLPQHHHSWHLSSCPVPRGQQCGPPGGHHGLGSLPPPLRCALQVRHSFHLPYCGLSPKDSTEQLQSLLSLATSLRLLPGGVFLRRLMLSKSRASKHSFHKKGHPLIVLHSLCLDAFPTLSAIFWKPGLRRFCPRSTV